MAIELDKIVAVRFRTQDHLKLKARAKERGLLVSELVRDAALGVPPAPPRRTLVAEDLINQLSRVGNNLNQQSRVLHRMDKRGDLPHAKAVLARLDEVEKVLVDLSCAVADATQ